MNEERFLTEYENLLDKGYCNCNEMNCIDNNSPRRILNIAKRLQKENKQLKGSLQTYEILLKANVEENQQLKEIIDKAKEFAKGHIFQFDGDKDFDALLEILEKSDK